MFTVYHSNQLDVLKTLIARIMAARPLADVLADEVVLVQSPGMAQWLQMSLAEELDIAANMTFPLPATFIWDLFTRVLPDIPPESAFSKSGMSWKLMTILPEMLTDPAFSQLQHYLQDDNDQRKLFQLAQRVADLFDQYLVYRPDWLNLWEKGQQVSTLTDQNQSWQACLWRRLVAYTAELGQSGWHRANLYQRFIQRLAADAPRPAGLPDRVFICGISALPPVYLQALQALGNHIDVHLMFTHPCRHYWGDIQDYAFLSRLQQRHRRHYLTQQPLPQFRHPQSAATLFNEAGEQNLSNPLLASWGKHGRDNLYLLAALDANEVSAFVDIDATDLLSHLHHDLLELEDKAVIGMDADSLKNSANKRILQPDDNSFSLHVCHSPQREVEVLQDYLLQLLDSDPSLTPRDIIVMVADIDSYAPFIQAVFGNAPGTRYLPFAISDRRARHAHPIIPAFLTLLSLADSRFCSEEILALLEVPALAARFSIEEADRRRLRLWVEESGIRWGLDDSSVADLQLPPGGHHTWQSGLMRMLLGYAMESETGQWQGVLPYDESSGLVAELAGNLACLLETLSLWRARLKEARSLSDWLPLCHALLADFFVAESDSEAALTLIEAQWQQVVTCGLQAGFSTEITITLLRDDITNRLDNERISQRFLAGPINFCTLMPMRSIPFRVVCLLGMNDGVYPRNLPALGFDLMSQQSRRGDRSRRDDDRYLFLEALFSARQRLYISYIGRAIQDNSERLPSVLLSELMEYIAQSFVLAGDSELEPDVSARRVKQHLQYLHGRTPFALQNFLPDSRWRSYASEWLPAATGSGAAHPPFIQPLSAFTPDSVVLENFLRFWRHPVRAFFNQRLGVSFFLEETRLPDAEPFTLDSLSRYQLNTALLNTLVREGDASQLLSRYRAAGQLPYGAFGELIWQQQLEEMQPLAERITNQLQPVSQQEIILTFGQIQLNGWLSQIQPDGLLRWRPGVLNISDGLQLWLEHLAWCASGGDGVSRMLGRNDSQWYFAPVAAARAHQLLAHYMSGYLSGMQQPLLLARSAGVWLEALFDSQTATLNRAEVSLERARGKFMQSWQGGFQTPGEGSDVYLQRLMRTLDEAHFTEMVRQAEIWLLPLLEARIDPPGSASSAGRPGEA
ncbi:exodeoxyribonuclease V subunit gamma [Erwinia sp. OLTSP20]|uniref:exodeoxyribonuclease V subunit gamma n=1 Tax=unclassified Erwinia TaxID=2622719 RepID=UPI000C178024|nr:MULTISPECIES: exodeoxyribonuclease V subunit gamma [unclassified Erwinia]PIJ49039.1 exodeoxyribonuclease V subunit gamma [Erwinia sp. OAMSP11]PIJ75033.1 exodeoxyribonuclease V subunit gamma [Erwinia sp. OLSSP12]PIJ79724.1 exodeoxyribonuclease V subunit gamma [Erwinia sp. OLCASP19]PIJ80509.1 exodeoxyribonuclease V subunit gamma [Erwinia sp. OLMTSP26]PIJ82624.1 exodeoxyribonuclease V subunit gamma [Erwinia sp. OLMDSP33]